MSIIKRNINGITYIYEIISYRNKEGKPRNKQRLLGKLDPSTGEMIETRKKKVPSKNPKDDSIIIVKSESCKTKELVSGTSKVEQIIFDPRKNHALYDPKNTGSFETHIGNLKNKTISTVASIDFDKMKSLEVSIPHEKWLTPFDREILSIASSLYAAGNEYQSPFMIYQALSGNKENLTLTPEMRRKIIESLKKLRMNDINIDSSPEEKVGWNKKGNYEGALLPSERIEIMTLNGQEVFDCIHFLRNSPLYDYAAGKNQISRVNIEMLNVPINNTEDNVILKCHLLRLITSMKNSKSKLKPVIRYDTLFEYLGLDEIDNDNTIRHKKQHIRERVKEILNCWGENDLITGFEEETEGRGKEIVKVKISL